MPRPEYLGPKNRGGHFIRCPECGAAGTIDEEQYRGEVSIICPKCDYHETHDLTDEQSPDQTPD